MLSIFLYNNRIMLKMNVIRAIDCLRLSLLWEDKEKVNVNGPATPRSQGHLTPFIRPFITGRTARCEDNNKNKNNNNFWWAWRYALDRLRGQTFVYSLQCDIYTFQGNLFGSIYSPFFSCLIVLTKSDVISKSGKEKKGMKRWSSEQNTNFYFGCNFYSFFLKFQNRKFYF